MSVDRRNGEKATFVFPDYYALTADMSFGIIATERIGRAKPDDDPNLASIRDQWKSLGVPPDLLNCYRLAMSSTGSVIRLYSEQFEIV